MKKALLISWPAGTRSIKSRNSKMGFKMRTLNLPKARTEQDLLIIHDSPVKRFSWKEVKEATGNFSSKNVVGRGGFGKVYQGQLPDGSLVAIKRCKVRTPERDLQFQAEVEIGGNQVVSRHKNLLGLLGYCMTRSERLLVYPLLYNGSVDSKLRKRVSSFLANISSDSESLMSKPTTLLDWTGRKRIALGVANGLAHLHSGSCFAVIHRDVKTANILLDGDSEAVLCDFGLAKVVAGSSKENEIPSASGWLQRTVEEEEEEEDSADEEADRDRLCFPIKNTSCLDLTRIVKPDDEEAFTCSCWLFTAKTDEVRAPTGHQQSTDRSGTELQTNCVEVTTMVRGTKGHIAPEYHATSKCSIKNDVFAYGIVLLELITGQRAFDKARHGNGMLLDWVNGLLGDDKLDLIFDPNIKGNYIQEEIEELLELALLCTTTCPADRPEMSKIIEMIENIGNPNPLHHHLGNVSVEAFSLHRLRVATKNFSDKNMIGKSGFCNLYRGRLKEDGSYILVKRLAKTGKLYTMQLQGEVKLGGMSGHPNVLKLIGYCFTWSKSLIVYPFTFGRSLEWYLEPESLFPPVLQFRMRIALGVAKGLAYMHDDCGTIHGNVKPSSILLEDGHNPVLCNFRIPVKFEDWNQEIGTSTHSTQDGFNNDVYWYGVTLLVLISNVKAAAISNSFDSLVLHNWLIDRLRYRQLDLVVAFTVGIKIEQLFQVVLLCTQPSQTARPHMREVIQMLDGIHEGNLKVCFLFDRANLFWFVESDHLGAIMDSSISSKAIIISENVVEQKTFSGCLKWKDFISEVVSDGLPTKANLFQTGMSVDPLCPLCEEYEEDSFHLFFKCHVSRQAWQIVVGVRIDMVSYGSAKEAVDAIMKPDGAGINILPWGVDAVHFSQKGVAVMYSIWTHRNKVCFENVSPDVMDIVSSSESHFSEYLVPYYDEMAGDMRRYYDSESDLAGEELSGPR